MQGSDSASAPLLINATMVFKNMLNQDYLLGKQTIKIIRPFLTHGCEIWALSQVDMLYSSIFEKRILMNISRSVQEN